MPTTAHRGIYSFRYLYLLTPEPDNDPPPVPAVSYSCDIEKEWESLTGRAQPDSAAARRVARLHPVPRRPGDPCVQLYFNIWADISYGYVGQAAGFDEGTLL